MRSWGLRRTSRLFYVFVDNLHEILDKSVNPDLIEQRRGICKRDRQATMNRHGRNEHELARRFATADEQEILYRKRAVLNAADLVYI